MKLIILFSAIFFLVISKSAYSQDKDYLFEGEKHFKNIKMLTTDGENAEAYFSFDGKKLVYQSTFDTMECDQIFTINIDGTDRQLVSTGKGRTTCAYFYPDGERIIYASTHLADDNCPPPPDRSKGYVWKLYDSFDIFLRDGNELKQLTDSPGYDGGPFFSPDGSKIVFRASRPITEEQMADYNDLVENGYVRPTALEIFVMDADGKNMKQITSLGKESFAPFFHPSGNKIIFSSNYQGDNPRDFNLFMINVDGTGLERITFNPSFDGFPMFSPNGKYLVFGSNRFNKKETDTNIFIAEWVD